MSWQDLIRDIPVARVEAGARDAFILNDRDAFHIVESGQVELFAVVVKDDGTVSARRPFVASMPAGKALFGAPVLPVAHGDERGSFMFQAVPSRHTVLVRGERKHLASPDAFGISFVSLIDDWVIGLSDFVARHEPPVPRAALLLTADPDVPYEASSVLSAHHHEVLWVWADRPMEFIGLPEFGVPREAILPLSEHVWLNLPEEARVSAVHTPSAVVSEKLWTGLDRYHVQVLRCAERAWMAHRREEGVRHAGSQSHKTRLREGLVRDLSGILSDVRPPAEAVHGYRSGVHAAAAIVAEAVGVTLVDTPAALGDDNPLDAAASVVAPSGVRTRQIELSPGWERRDGPSFLGVVPGDEPRPVAVVNRGGGAFEMIDPVSGETARVNRARAEALHAHGVMFYPPLPPGVDSGLAAVFQTLRGRGRDLLAVGLMGAMGALVALLTPIVTGELLAEIIPRVDIPMWVAALAGLAVGAVTTLAVSVVGAFGMLRIEARIDETLQAAIWNRLLALPLPFFRQYLAGDLADRANGVSIIRQLLTGAAGSSLVSGVFSVFSFLLLFYYSWVLALWAGVAVALLAGGSWFFAIRQVRHQRDAFIAQGGIDGLIFQLILGLPKIRQANVEANALKRWSEQYAEQRRAQLSARKWAAGQLTFNALFTPLSQLALLAMIWYMLIESETEDVFTLADFLSFNAAFGQFVAGVTGLTATWTTVIAILPLFERVMPIIETQPEGVSGGARCWPTSPGGSSASTSPSAIRQRRTTRSRTSPSISVRASTWLSSDRRAPASRPCIDCCWASSNRAPGACCSTGTTCSPSISEPCVVTSAWFSRTGNSSRTASRGSSPARRS